MEIKPPDKSRGIRSSEGQLTLAALAGSTYAALEGILPPNEVGFYGTIILVTYIVCRTLRGMVRDWKNGKIDP